jgi:hypothetical protein
MRKKLTFLSLFMMLLASSLIANINPFPKLNGTQQNHSLLSSDYLKNNKIFDLSLNILTVKSIEDCTTPLTYTVTGGGSYCAGGAGVAVGLSNSETGVSYQLKNGATNVGSAVLGTGELISFGNQTVAATYTVEATSTTGGCSVTMIGSAVVSINALPTLATVTGGGTYCDGSPVVSVGLSASQSGVTYQLFKGAAAEGSAIAGTDNALDFGPQPQNGYYTVVATTTSTGCTSTMNGIAYVVIRTLPTETLTPTTQSICNGTSITPIDISPSVNNSLVTYSSNPTNATGGTASLFLANGVFFNLTNTSSESVIVTKIFPLIGSIVNYGNNDYRIYTTVAGQTAEANYTNPAAWEANTSWSEILPTSFSTYYYPNGVSLDKPFIIAPGESRGFYLASMNTNARFISYWTGSITASNNVAGPTSFSDGTLTYDAKARNNTGLFTSVTAGVAPLRGSFVAPYTLFSYRKITSQVSWTRDNTTNLTGFGVATASTGNNIFPLGGTFNNNTTSPQTTVYTATIMGTNGCSVTKTVSVTVQPSLNTYMVTGGGTYCAGGSGVSIGLANSDNGFSYQLKVGTTNVGSPVIGTGAAISFGNKTAAGVYSVVATSLENCTATMAGTVTITVNALPTAFNVTGTSSYCTGSAGVAVGLSGSQTGIVYQLKNGSVDVGVTVAGTGSAISFGIQTTGTYTVVATNSTSSCTATMTGSAVVTSMICLSGVLSGTQTIIAKDAANLVVTVAGGTSPYTIVYNDGTSDITVNNYVSGTNIVVTPSVSTTYTLISLKDAVNANGTVSGSAIVTTTADVTPPILTPSDDIIDACSVPNPLPTSSKPTISDNAQTPATLTLMSTVTGTLTTALTALKYTKYFIRTWKATDNNGNTATATQNVYLRDNIAPTITCKNVSVTVGTADVTITAVTLLNTATDNCVASPTIAIAKGMVITGLFSSNVKYTTSTIPAGTSTVQATLRATDGLNAGFCTATITFTKNVPLANGNNNSINQNTIIDEEEDGETMPQIAIKQGIDMRCFPNPFSDDLNINYNLTQAANNVILKVYDNQGRLMTTHEMNAQVAGDYEMRWNLSDLASGMYHICLEIDGKCMKMERVIMIR